MTLTRFEFTRRARPLLQVGLGSTEIGLGVGRWDVSLWDAPGSSWNGDEPLWRDVSCDAISARIELGRGRLAESFPVGRCDVVVDNTSGWADPSTNFEVDSEPGYITFDGGGGELTVPDSAALDISGDLVMIARVFLVSHPLSSCNFVRKGDPLPGSTLAYRMSLFPNTDFQSTVSADGTIAGSQSFQTANLPYMAGHWRWIAFAFDANDGSGGCRGSHWYGGVDMSPFAWQHIETTIVPTGAMTIFNSPDALKIGQNLSGLISHLEIRAGHGGLDGSGRVLVGGTAVFKLDGWELMPSSVGASTFTVATGQTVTVNTVGDSTPTVTAAVNPVGGALLKMRPGRPIRVGVAHDAFGERWRFNGFIDEILPVDDPEDWSTVRLVCIDALGEVGRAKLASDVETGAGEQAQTRFTRILNSTTWPTTKRSISTSAIRPLYATELDGQVVDLLRQTAESDGGWAFGDDQARIVLQHRDWLYHPIDEPVDATIGNLGGVAFDLALESGDALLLEQSDTVALEATEDEVCPSRWERSFARRDISTRVLLDRDVSSDVEDPPAPVEFIDRPAEVLYGVESYERRDLWTLNTTDLQQIAGRILATRSASLSMPRISAVTIDAATSTLALDLLSTMSIFTPSRYRCRLRTTRGDVFDAKFFAVGVVEDIAADGWTAEISLDRTDPFGILDPGSYAWDTGRWDRSLWN